MFQDASGALQTLQSQPVYQHYHQPDLRQYRPTHDGSITAFNYANSNGNYVDIHQQQRYRGGVHDNSPNPPYSASAIPSNNNSSMLDNSNFDLNSTSSTQLSPCSNPSSSSVSTGLTSSPSFQVSVDTDEHGMPNRPFATPMETNGDRHQRQTAHKTAKKPQQNSSSLEYQNQNTVNDKSITNRKIRNEMEKLRRDRINKCILELAKLVPFIANCPKKPQKANVLRLSAAFLRLNQTLLGLEELQQALPPLLRNVNLARIFLSEKDMYLMITATGKIVFVSEAVENLLGHTQNDLFGHSLYDIILPIDREELMKNLKWDKQLYRSSNNTNTSGIRMQRRSFYLRLMKKKISKNDEQPALELVYVSGCLLYLRDPVTKNVLGGNNSVLFHAVVRPFNEQRVTEVSLLEAYKEEYITRHLLDGRIIYVDSRISLVSGFMPQELSGKSAFTYMHKDDVRWVMIALRQMYYKGQSFGQSCYRLLSKNGEFVYMKTYGFLELNPNEDQVASFICINVMVSAEEGKKEILKMRERFTPLIRSRSDSGIAAITNNQTMVADTLSEGSATESVTNIDEAVKEMIKVPKQDIIIQKLKTNKQDPLPGSEYDKAHRFAKTIPLVGLPHDAPRFEMSMPSLLNNNIVNVPTKSDTELVKPVTPTVKIKEIIQDRPSVLQKAPPVARQSVVVYPEEDQGYLERRGGILVVPKRHNECHEVLQQCSKKPRIVMESQTNMQSDSSQFSNDSYDSMESSSRAPPKFCTYPVHNEHNIDIDAFTNETLTADLLNISNTLDDNNSLVNPLFMAQDNIITNYNPYNTEAYNEGNSIDINQDTTMQKLRQDGAEERDLLAKKQFLLQTRMDQQRGQLNEIQTGLNSLSSNVNTQFLRSNLSTLKAQHEEQQKQLFRSVKTCQDINV